jgi:hypothetical protein
MKIIFAGDFFYNNGKEPVIAHEKIKQATMGGSTFIVNLEGSIVEKDAAVIPKIGPILHQSERVVNILKNMGVSAVTLANNHIMDGDIRGIESTLSILNKSNIDFFGFDDPSFLLKKPLIRLNSGGKELSIISAAEEEFNGPSEFGCGANLIDPINLWTLVTEELGKGRCVIVVLHGGIEYEHIPPPWLRKLCHWLIDLGVTAIITHHPHVPGYIEIYNEKPIAWSLGNFWFSRGISKIFWNKVGYVFELSFDEHGTIDWKTYPYYSDYEEGIIRELKHGEMSRWNILIEDIQHVLGDTEAYSQWWDGLIKTKRREYQERYSLAYFPHFIGSVLDQLLIMFKFENQWRLWQLNGLRCKSHREIWIQSLKKLR